MADQDKGLSVKVDKFNAAMAELEKILGSYVTRKQIIDSEVASIMTATIKKTKTATTQSIINSLDKRPPYRTYDGKVYKLTNKYPDRIWSMLQQKMAESLKRKLEAKSLARRVWYEIGVRVGNVTAPSDTIKAKREGVNVAGNGKVQQQGSGDSYGLIVENHSPLIRYSDSRRALFSAIAGRVGFFKRNLKLGVFNDMAAVVKKYPGFKIS